ncbi:SRPBCC domain-containing protein [Paenibacillus sp. NPDC056579]|uniref:SRPBCC domain-containing protein n=1 Tax=Paenibacillus sp. NPDC056579 TaxID=3345871 RepID=UPI0036A73345
MAANDVKDLYYEFYVAGTPEQVWEALVSPEGVKAVYAGCVIESTFEAGASIQYVGPGNLGDRTVHVYGTILACEPNKTLSFTHYVGESYYEGQERYESRITYRIEPAGVSTKLMLTHDQWHEEDPSYKNTVSAWWFLLSSTKTWIETGKPLTW